MLILISCRKSNTYLENYAQALANVNITCPSGSSEFFLKSKLDEEELCYYEGVNNLVFRWGYSILFTTPGSSVSSGDTIQFMGRKGNMWFSDPDDPEQDGLEFSFPIGPEEQSELDYLDKLFAKESLIYNDPLDENNVVVEYAMKIPTIGGGANVYSNSSKNGAQDSGFFNIVNVERIEDEATVTFKYEFEFECVLYLNPQYRGGGVWRNLTDGILKGEIVVDKQG